jgi:cobalt/nickel transport system permease protein
MHMADALLSPAVGGTLGAVAAGGIAWSSRKLRLVGDDRSVPLMAVLGAFVFTAQMVKITIPATGSCGHLGGALLLAILLGPHAAFLAIASVLVVQALFFADGGLLALGCNIVNLGALTAFVAYPLVYRPLAGSRPGGWRRQLAIFAAALVSMQLAAFGVVLETCTSGISALPFTSFLGLMQPIHLAIGLLEGVATAAIIAAVERVRPELLDRASGNHPLASLRGVLLAFLMATLLTGGLLSNFVSEHPDGLDWAIARVAGSVALELPEDGVHTRLEAFQERLTLFPIEPARNAPPSAETAAPANDTAGAPTGIVGLVGGTMTLAICLLVGLLLRRRAPQG